YGQFNVTTRSGFERTRSGEALIIGGQQRTFDAALAYGDHTQTLAYFVQGSANSSDFGLTPPAIDAVHNRHTGGGGAGKLWMAARPSDIVTLTASVRRDDYQIPRTNFPREGFDSRQLERDIFFNALWTHSSRNASVWSVAPYYHFNRVALNPDVVPDLANAS